MTNLNLSSKARERLPVDSHHNLLDVELEQDRMHDDITNTDEPSVL